MYICVCGNAIFMNLTPLAYAVGGKKCGMFRELKQKERGRERERERERERDSIGKLM